MKIGVPRLGSLSIRTSAPRTILHDPAAVDSSAEAPRTKENARAGVRDTTSDDAGPRDARLADGLARRSSSAGSTPMVRCMMGALGVRRTRSPGISPTKRQNASVAHARRAPAIFPRCCLGDLPMPGTHSSMHANHGADSARRRQTPRQGLYGSRFRRQILRHAEERPPIGQGRDVYRGETQQTGCLGMGRRPPSDAGVRTHPA